MKTIRLLSLVLTLCILLPLTVACGAGTGGNETTTPFIDETTPEEAPADETTPEETTPEETAPEGSATLNRTPGVFVNVDLNSATYPYLTSVLKNNSTIEEKTIYPFVDQYKSTGVTDLSINVFTQISQTPSDVWMTVSDKYLQTTENGKPVDYKANFEMCYKFLEELEIDFTGVWLERCKDIGITPWINIRMNDCHNSGFSNPYFIRDDFFYEADHLPASYGYYQSCYDYADERVRQKMLDYIEEQVMRYDAHLELDFSREMYCFDYINNPDCHLIMTQFLRDVKEIVEAAEKKWGHDIKILIRLIRDVEQNKAMGFDVEAMANEELVDIVCICPRWTSSDSDMPLDEWKERFPTLEIYAGIEANLIDTIPQQAEVTYAYSAQYIAQGADKIYLYNYYSTPSFPAKPNANLEKLYKACGSLDKLERKDKRYVVAYQDICPSGFEPYKPLPTFAKDFSLTLSTAPILEKDTLTLYVGVHNLIKVNADNLTVKIGGVECKFEGEATIPGTNYTPKDTIVYKYTVDTASIVGETKLLIETDTNESSMGLMYLELYVVANKAY